MVEGLICEFRIWSIYFFYHSSTAKTIWLKFSDQTYRELEAIDFNRLTIQVAIDSKKMNLDKLNDSGYRFYIRIFTCYSDPVYYLQIICIVYDNIMAPTYITFIVST